MPKYILRGIGPPFPKQQQILDYLWQPSQHIRKVLIQCGLGFGKTTLLIDIAVRLLQQPFRTTTLFLEPDVKRMAMVFWVQWRKIVPEQYYQVKTLEGSHQKYIVWKSTGNLLFPAIRNITGNQQAVADSYRGIEFTDVLDDETAIKFNRKQYQNTYNRIRGSSPIRWYLSATTPQPGSYVQLTKMEDIKIFYGHTHDNIYLMNRHPTYVEDMKADMSPDEYRREILGELISLEGRIWKNADLENDYPTGNMIDYEFNPLRPYVLGCDIGVRSAWFVIQKKNLGFNNYAWVICAQFLPDDGNTDSVCQHINSLYGEPSRVCGGADLSTRNINTGHSAVKILRSNGWTCPIDEARGERANKWVQHAALDRCLLTKSGKRRLLISRDLKTYGNKLRGIVDLIEQDMWPEAPAEGQVFVKDKSSGGIGLEDARDGLLYTFVQLEPVHSVLQDVAS